jgi:hypothetical protein
VNKKGKLLISCSAHTFSEDMQPLVQKFSRNFSIVITIVNYNIPIGLVEMFRAWEKSQLIENYLVIPNFTDTLKLHLFMKAAIVHLRKYDFDFWISGGEMHVYERYILECALSKQCKRIILWPRLTYLFEHEDLARRLLSDADTAKHFAPQDPGALVPWFRFRNLIGKIRKTGSVSNILKKSLHLKGLRSYILRIFRNPYGKVHLFFDRILLPWFMVRKTFRLGQYDRFTQLGSGRADVIIFTDEIESKAHNALFHSPDIYVAQYPTYGSCRCKGDKADKTAILSPLSGYVGSNELSEKALHLFLRDFRIVVSQTDAECVHLRLHPRETGNWPYQLQDFLITNGIDASVVECDRPIREIMCDYIGMAGFASNCLRDGRACCGYVFVIGFVSVSISRYTNPKFVFGASEGIGWIEEDGSYESNIFSRNSFTPPKRKSIPDIVKELTRDQT